MRIAFEYNKKLKPRAGGLRQAGNYSEVVLWNELKNSKFCGLDFTRQAVVGSYIADFLCEAKKIIIEIDGSSHVGREEYDRVRDEYLAAAGYRVVRVSTDDIKYNLDNFLHGLQKRI